MTEPHPSPSPLPDNTAIRTALWRALHLEADAPPHVFEDDIALQLVDPDTGWQSRPDCLRPPSNSEALLIATTWCCNACR